MGLICAVLQVTSMQCLFDPPSYLRLLLVGTSDGRVRGLDVASLDVVVDFGCAGSEGASTCCLQVLGALVAAAYTDGTVCMANCRELSWTS